jgi:predicted Zn-dependent protease
MRLREFCLFFIVLPINLNYIQAPSGIDLFWTLCLRSIKNTGILKGAILSLPRFSRIARNLLTTLVIASLLVPRASRAQDSASENGGLIRDAEIERDIRVWVTPIFHAAGLDANFVQIYLIGDSQINSFVAGGQRIFINTGLLTRSKTPNQVIGVIAHETGHIAGGHLLRMQEVLRAATVEAIAGFLIGAGAAFGGAGGSGVGAGAIAGESMAQRAIFAYSINQEARADNAALSFLDKTHQSSRGLLEFFQILGKEEGLLPGMQDPYLRTHPLTDERIDYVRHHVETSPYSGAKDPPEWVEQHARIVAKLQGFLLPPFEALKRYPTTDDSTAAHYARAIAYHRVPMEDHAMQEMDILLKREPKNPYFWELKGQFLFESGHPADAVPSYRKAVEFAEDEALLKIELAQDLLEANEDVATAKEAEGYLKDVLRHDDQNPDAWHSLGIAQGRMGEIGNASLALAEEAILSGDTATARSQAIRATELLPRGSPGWLKADDIRLQIKDNR